MPNGPLVIGVAFTNNKNMSICRVKVRITKESSLVLKIGKLSTKASPKILIVEISHANKKNRFNCCNNKAFTYAPSPRKAACIRDIYPVRPEKKLIPNATMAKV